MLSRGHLAMSETFLVVITGPRGHAPGWVEVRDALQHSTMHRTALATMSYPVQNASRATVRKSELNDNFLEGKVLSFTLPYHLT